MANELDLKCIGLGFFQFFQKRIMSELFLKHSCFCVMVQWLQEQD